jgi:hypothetical protein
VILGLPTLSFVLLLGIPFLMLLVMLFDVWRIKTGRKN